MADNSAKWPADSFGIYLILNKESGRINVGATGRSFKTRWGDHRCDLRAGRHRNPLLQRSFDRGGEKAFIMMKVEVLDVRDPNRIAERENFWIKELQSRVEDGGFNLKDGEAMTAYSDVTKLLMSKIAYARRGYKFKFKGPDGKTIEIKDLPVFCAERGLSPTHMTEVFAGRRLSHGGFVRFDSDYKPRRHRPTTFRDPDGKEYMVTNVTKFAKEQKLIPSCMLALKTGTYSHHRGWTLVGPPQGLQESRRPRTHRK